MKKWNKTPQRETTPMRHGVLQPGCRASALPLLPDLKIKIMRKERGHLPFFGIGPLYVALVCGLTAAGVWASSSGLLESGIVPGLKVPMRVAGVLVALAGLFIWLVALLGARIDDGIRNNRLVTDGVCVLVADGLYDAPHRGEMAAPPLRSRVRRLLPPR